MIGMDRYILERGDIKCPLAPWSRLSNSAYLTGNLQDHNSLDRGVVRPDAAQTVVGIASQILAIFSQIGRTGGEQAPFSGNQWRVSTQEGYGALQRRRHFWIIQTFQSGGVSAGCTNPKSCALRELSLMLALCVVTLLGAAEPPFMSARFRK